MVCFLKKGVCQYEKIETNPICNCDSNIAIIYYWWNFVLSSQTILVILVCGGALIIGLLLKFFDKK